MKIVGCDLHTRYQQIAMLDQETGELVERRLEHESGEAQAFYAALAGPVRVGIEATGHTRWFERLLAEQGHELWIGDAAQIRASVVRKQKTDARDAAHLLELLLSERFPRIWRPTLQERDLRQLVWHRQKLVWMRWWHEQKAKATPKAKPSTKGKSKSKPSLPYGQSVQLVAHRQLRVPVLNAKLGCGNGACAAPFATRK